MNAIHRLTRKGLDLVKKYKNSQYASGIMMAFTASTLAIVFFLLDYFYSKILDVSAFADWKLLYMIVGLATPLLAFGFPEGYKYYIARENRKSEFFSSFIAVFCGLFLLELIAVLVINLLHYYQIVNIGNFYLVSLIFPIAFFVFGVSQVLRYTYINEKKIITYTKTIVVCTLVVSLVIVLFASMPNLAKATYLYQAIIFYILIIGLPVFWLFKYSSLHLNRTLIEKSAIRKMLIIGFPLYAATFIGIINVNLSRLVVKMLDSKEAFAIFSVGAFEIPIFAMISAAFSQNIYPSLVKYMSENKREDAHKLWIATTKRVSFLTYPVLLIFMIFAKEIIFFVYSDKYADSVVLFQTFLLIGLFRNNFYGSLIVASGKTKFITLYSALAFASNMVFSVGLFYLFGLKGIVYGVLLSTVVINILQLNHEKLLKAYFTDFLFDKRIALLILAILGAYFYYQNIQ